MGSAPAWQLPAAAKSSHAAAQVAARSYRPKTAEAPPRKLKMIRLRHRTDFLRAQRGRRVVKPSVTLETIATPADYAAAGAARIGFTATRKIGGAVERNRAKRRLRAAAAQLLPLYGREGSDYVLVARAATLTAPFAQILDDMTAALKSVRAAKTESRS